jgi:dolichol kinase
LTIVLSVLLWLTASDYLIGIFWPLYCLFFFDLLLLIISLLSFDHCIVCINHRRTDNTMAKRYQWDNQKPKIKEEQTIQWSKDTNEIIRSSKSKKNRQYNGFTTSDYLIGIFWPLYCLFFFDLWLVMISLVSFDHCIVCSSVIYSQKIPMR